MIFQSIINLTRVCYDLGVRNVVTSPGSRSAPLTLAFSRNSNFDLFSVNDERSAGFIGLGMALSSQQPVVIICTSGSALYNLAPAVAEAYYQQIPLILLTADRPPEWTDQWDGQTIKQANIYGQHVKGFFQLPTDLDHPDSAWQIERMISEAINLCQEPAAGPVQVNCPFREPFYPTKSDSFDFESRVKSIYTSRGERTAKNLDWTTLSKEWNECHNKLIIIGQHSADQGFSQALTEATSTLDVPIIADVLSNQLQGPNRVVGHDSILISGKESVVDPLKPDLLITMGQSVISKNLKLFIRNNPPSYHWHISNHTVSADPFKSLTHNLVGPPESFLLEMIEQLSKDSFQKPFLDSWVAASNRMGQFQENLMEKLPFGEFSATLALLSALPQKCILHLGNSMPVRYVNLMAAKIGPTIEVFGNRGTSGIDGCISTAVGHALTTSRQVLVLAGDVSFFYDRNALWHRHKPNNLKVVIMNNRGGGIFRIIDGPASQPELEEYFVGSQSLDAKNTAIDYGLEYFSCSENNNLASILSEFMAGEKSSILEIFTDPMINVNAFKQYKASIQESYES